jgi:TRAP-type C4-dicarboxylate transport system permease small subunit
MMVDRLPSALRWLSHACLVAAGVAIAAMMLHVGADIAGSALLGRSLGGTIEMVSGWYMPACVFLPLVAVQQHRGQIIVEFATQALGPRKRALFDGLAAALGCAYVGAMVYTGAHEAWTQTAIGERANSSVFDFPVWPTRWFPVVGGAGMAAWLVLQSLSDLAFAATGRRPEPPGEPQERR